MNYSAILIDRSHLLNYYTQASEIYSQRLIPLLLYIQVCVKYNPVCFKFAALFRAIAKRLQHRKRMLS